MYLFRDDFTSNLYDPSQKTQTFTNKIKLALYFLYGKLLHYCPKSLLLYIFLLLCEFWESFYYVAIHLSSSLDFPYDLPNKSLFPYLYIVVCSVILVYIGIFFTLLAISYCSANDAATSKDKHTTGEEGKTDHTGNKGCLRLCFAVFSFLLLVYEHILVLPFSWFLLVPFAHETERDFTNSIATIIISSVFIVLSLVLTLLTNFFYHDQELGSKIPWSLTPILANILKTITKLVVAFALGYERSGNAAKWLLAIICVLLLFQIASLIAAQEMPNKAAELLLNVFRITELLGSALVLADLVFTDFLMDYPAMLISLLLAAALLVFLLKRRQRVKVVSDKSAWKQPERFVRQVLYLTEDESCDKEYSAPLIGLLKFHVSNCTFAECPCKEISLNNKEEDDQCLLNASEMLPNSSVFIDNRERQNYQGKSKKSVYSFLNYLVKNKQIQAAAQASSHILSAQLQLKYLANEFQALYELQEAEDSNPSISEEYFIYRLKDEIEGKIVGSNTVEERSAQGIGRWISFYGKFILMQDLIGATTDFYIKFWLELLKDIPKYSELSKLGYKISLHLDRIQVLFKQTTEILQSNANIYIIYMLFLFNVTQDRFVAHEMYLEAKRTVYGSYMNRKHWISAEDNCNDKISAAVILISANKTNIGTILNTNNELWRLLGYEKRVVLGHNVSALMPEAVAQHHNKFIQQSFTNSLSSVLYSKDKLVFAQHFAGHLVPCMLLTRLIPNLAKGIQFIGFLNKASFVDELRKGETKVSPDEMIILMLDKEMRILGFNKVFANALNRNFDALKLQKYHEADRKIDLSSHYPSVFSPDGLEQLMAAEGVSECIDFTPVMQQFQEETVDEAGSAEQSFLLGIENVNVKLKEYKYLQDALRYFMCTIYIDSKNTKQAIRDQREDSVSPEDGEMLEEKKELEDISPESASVTTTSTSTQSTSNVKTIKDFRLRMRDTKDPSTVQCFRFASYILLVLLIVVYSVVYSQKVGLKNLYYTGFNIMIEKYQRVDNLLKVVYATRTVRNIYMGRQPNSNEFFADRGDFYFSSLSNRAQNLLKTQEAISNRQSGTDFESAADKYNAMDAITTYSIDAWDGHTVTSFGVKFPCSLKVAIGQIVTRATDIVGVPREEFEAGRMQDFAEWDRNVAFVVYNSVHTILPIAQLSSEEIMDFVKDKGSSKQNLLIWITVLSIALAMVSLVSLMPFICKAHSGILVVIHLFVKLPKDDVLELIQSSENCKKQVTNGFRELVSEMNKISFDDESNMERSIKNNISKAKQANKPKENEDSSESTEDPLAKAKELEIKRKLSLVGGTSATSRNILFAEICGMIVVIGIYFAVTMVIRVTQFNKVNKLLEVTSVYMRTIAFVNYVFVVTIEDFSGAKVNCIDFWDDNRSEYERTFGYLNTNLRNRELIEKDVEKKFPRINEMLSRMNSGEFCDLTSLSEEVLIDCRVAYYNILNYGFEVYLHQFTLTIDILYNHFLLALEENDTVYLENVLRMERYIDLLDTNSGVVSQVDSFFTDNLVDFGRININKAGTFDLIDYIVFILLMVGIFLVALSFFLMSFKSSIWKAKQMLGIMPTKFIAKDLDKVKLVMQEIT